MMIKIKSILILTSVFLLMLRAGTAQNSFQKILSTDSLGFFGLAMKSDSSYLLGIQTNKSCKILKVDNFGKAVNASILLDSAQFYMQQIIPLRDGGSLMIGNMDGVPLVINLNANDEIRWARNQPGFGTGDSFFFTAAEDSLGNIALLENFDGNFSLHCLDSTGQSLWYILTDSVSSLNFVKCAKGGGFYLSGSTNGKTFLWKISPEGITTETIRFSIPEMFPMLMDLLELPDGARLFLFQYTINYKSYFVLVYVLPDSFIQYAYAVGTIMGFKFISNLYQPNSNRITVMGNVYQQGIGPIYNHPYKILRADFTLWGSLLTARQYSGDHVITGLSQALVTPDHGILACGFACDSMSYPFFPFLLKTDEQAYVSCFIDTVPLNVSPYMLSLQHLDDQLIPLPDSMLAVDLHLGNIPLPVLSTLCYTGIIDNTPEQEFRLYPNPADESITIDLENLQDNIQEILVLNLQGQIVKKQVIQKGKNQIEIPIENLSSGIYFVSLRGSKALIYKKFIKD